MECMFCKPEDPKPTNPKSSSPKTLDLSRDSTIMKLDCKASEPQKTTANTPKRPNTKPKTEGQTLVLLESLHTILQRRAKDEPQFQFRLGCG